MILCVVTDRRRTDPVRQAADAAAAGIDILHLRERDLEAAALASLVGQVMAMIGGSTMRVVVNDRLDVALTSGADGVHLRGDSIDSGAARRLAPRPFVIGRSVHHADEAAAAGDVDYLIAGTLFASASKPAATQLLGADGLRAIVGAARAPVLAIGGVTMDGLDAIAAAGAAGVAAIGLFAGDALRRGVTETLRRRFDSVNWAP